MLPFQGHEYIILGPIRILAYTLLMYNIRIHEANVVNPALPAFLHFHPARLQIKGGNENLNDLVELEYTIDRKYLHRPYTDEGLV